MNQSRYNEEDGLSIQSVAVLQTCLQDTEAHIIYATLSLSLQCLMAKFEDC